MTRRVLPRAEWSRLAGTSLEHVCELLPPSARVLVVEDAGAIVGCWAFLSVLHAEGVWIAPENRRESRVARHLLLGMKEIAAAEDARSIWTGSASDEIARICQRLGGTQVPFTSWVIPMVKGES